MSWPPLSSPQDRPRRSLAAWLEQRERSNALALRAMTWIARRLGRAPARALLYPVCAYYVAFSMRARRASRAYLKRVLGRPPKLSEVFHHYHVFASVVLDRVFLLTGQRDSFDICLHNSEVVSAIAASGSGAILAGAHYGSFEVLRAVGLANDVRVKLTMYEGNARKLRALVRALDARLEQDIIPLGGAGSMLAVRDAVAQGYFVGVLADRGLPGARATQCPFLGSDAPFVLGPWQLARSLSVPVVLMFGVYNGGARYDVYFERCDPVADPVVAARAFAARLEAQCRASPYNWFNFYDFWRTKPA